MFSKLKMGCCVLFSVFCLPPLLLPNIQCLPIKDVLLSIVGRSCVQLVVGTFARGFMMEVYRSVLFFCLCCLSFFLGINISSSTVVVLSSSSALFKLFCVVVVFVLHESAGKRARTKLLLARACI